MARIGKRILKIPSNTQVTITNGIVTIKGSAGTLEIPFPNVLDVVKENDTIKVNVKDVNNKNAEIIQGTINSLINNAIKGTVTPFVKKLKIVGVGYKASIANGNLNLLIGFSHPIVFKIPANLN
ncbi:MAG: 50S ribosomal protein L6, partial [Mycoplasmataceae bacterium]|nr:50S ribosomal protein L6 [Mycoplasmataceae bacterium]